MESGQFSAAIRELGVLSGQRIERKEASRVSAAIEKRVQAQLRAGKGILKVAREVGVGTGTVQRIKQEMTGPFVDAAA